MGSGRGTRLMALSDGPARACHTGRRTDLIGLASDFSSRARFMDLGCVAGAGLLLRTKVLANSFWCVDPDRKDSAALSRELATSCAARVFALDILEAACRLILGARTLAGA